MINDKDLIQSLNLVRGSRQFVLRCHEDGSMDVLNLGLIPKDEFTYLVYAQISLPNGLTLPSVVHIAEGGGSTIQFYLFVGDAWYKPEDTQIPTKLNISHEEIYPFDWKYSVPVENDIYHK